MTKLTKFYKFLLYLLPGILCFSYYPVIALGATASMNFELSLPLLWLVLFDIVALIIIVRRKLLFRAFGRKWLWLLFPIFATLSLLWSPNLIRGLLTMGILWLVYFAGYAMWQLRSILSDSEFKHRFWRIFFGSYLVICVWCVVQCIMDLAGAPRTISLMCAGCTYEMFGFPHPNGFAIEPQFMGNLLLAPAIISGYWAITDRTAASSTHALAKGNTIMFFAFSATLFLTFSRGAIYAFVVAIALITIVSAVRQKSWRVCKVPLIVAAAFLFTLNLQGIMAQVSPTSDTYGSGIAKVLNHLSLGIIDIRESTAPDTASSAEDSPALASASTEEISDDTARQSVFDGYVAESTDTRVRLSSSALEIWSKTPITALAGVGIGGAGQALYVHDLSPTPKEIVQNEYANLLLETGLIGISLFVFTLILVVRAVRRFSSALMIFALLAAYGITLVFFSGLPNALHVYLLPILVIVLYGKNSSRTH